MDRKIPESIEMSAIQCKTEMNHVVLHLSGWSWLLHLVVLQET